jgi:hypothetical protein
VESCLKVIDSEVGDTTDTPLCVDMPARYGGKPFLYTVFIRTADKIYSHSRLSIHPTKTVARTGSQIQLGSDFRRAQCDRSAADSAIPSRQAVKHLIGVAWSHEEVLYSGILSCGRASPTNANASAQTL